MNNICPQSFTSNPLSLLFCHLLRSQGFEGSKKLIFVEFSKYRHLKKIKKNLENLIGVIFGLIHFILLSQFFQKNF